MFELLFGLERFDALSNYKSEMLIFLQGIPNPVLQTFLSGRMDEVQLLPKTSKSETAAR